MLKATFKSLLARKARLLMSAMAIVLGTAFVAGSLIFTDTLSRTFDGIMDGTVGDVVVQPEQTDEYGGTGGGRMSAADVDKMAELPGAARADGSVDAIGVFVVGDNGKVGLIQAGVHTDGSFPDITPEDLEAAGLREQAAQWREWAQAAQSAVTDR